ncbi:MAG: adenosylcobinamide amidohydrolase [Candidatus Thermoplasmatota archaeon]|nr:adenosylcobinamide amidohydrolase [Candidatus Thermoplasmatota archaeon]
MDAISNRYCRCWKERDFYLLDFNDPVTGISSAPFNGGFRKIRRYMNRQVPLDYNHDPVKEIGAFLDRNNFPRENCVVTITACDLKDAYLRESSNNDIYLLISITACFANALSIGGTGLNIPGTVNIAVFTDYALSAAGGLNLYQSIVEAKSQAFNDFRIMDKTTGNPSPGTSTDKTSLFLINAETGSDYGGRLTEIGKMVSLAVYNGLEYIHSRSCDGDLLD